MVQGITSAHKKQPNKLLTKSNQTHGNNICTIGNMAIHPAKFGKTTMAMTSAFKNITTQVPIKLQGYPTL